MPGSGELSPRLASGRSPAVDLGVSLSPSAHRLGASAGSRSASFGFHRKLGV